MAQAYLTNKGRYSELKTKLLPQQKTKCSIMNGQSHMARLRRTTAHSDAMSKRHHEHDAMKIRCLQAAFLALIHVICITSRVSFTYYWDRWVHVAVNATKCCGFFSFFFFFFAIRRKKMNAQYYSHNAILAKRSSTIYSGLKPPTFTALCAQSFVEDNAFNKQAVMNPPKFDRET